MRRQKLPIRQKQMPPGWMFRNGKRVRLVVETSTQIEMICTGVPRRHYTAVLGVRAVLAINCQM